jgi:Flp pilus assembly protein TadB
MKKIKTSHRQVKRKPLTDTERFLRTLAWRKRHLAFLSVAVPVFVFVLRVTSFVLQVVFFSLLAATVFGLLTSGRRRRW